ncbi:MAG: GNAT family N-acetyltransferase [Parvibaculaceae bacterium]
MHLRIAVDDLSGAQVMALLKVHLDAMHAQSPAESVHALDLTGLRQPAITFWGVWDGDILAGCGALKELSREHGEVKSMRTDARYMRRGVAASLMTYMLDEARARGYRRLSLETGSQASFEPARTLYARFGFQYGGPFANYMPDPNSVFMTIAL